MRFGGIDLNPKMTRLGITDPDEVVRHSLRHTCATWLMLPNALGKGLWSR